MTKSDPSSVRRSHFGFRRWHRSTLEIRTSKWTWFDTRTSHFDIPAIPVALGEQEFSQWRFHYTIRERVADIVQPDLFYYGGLIRSIRVARMAALRDMPASPHLSGGFGFVYLLHFASWVPKIGPWQEYKEGVKQYGNWFNPPLRSRREGEWSLASG